MKKWEPTLDDKEKEKVNKWCRIMQTAKERGGDMTLPEANITAAGIIRQYVRKSGSGRHWLQTDRTAAGTLEKKKKHFHFQFPVTMAAGNSYGPRVHNTILHTSHKSILKIWKMSPSSCVGSRNNVKHEICRLHLKSINISLRRRTHGNISPLAGDVSYQSVSLISKYFGKLLKIMSIKCSWIDLKGFLVFGEPFASPNCTSLNLKTFERRAIGGCMRNSIPGGNIVAVFSFIFFEALHCWRRRREIFRQWRGASLRD